MIHPSKAFWFAPLPQVVWSAIVAEPDTLHSPDWVWKVSKTVFAFTQAVTYKVLTIIFAPLLAFIIALHFAMLSFSVSPLFPLVSLVTQRVINCINCCHFSMKQIWCANPINRFLHVGFSSVRTFLEILSNAIFGPIIETIGLCLSKLKIRHQRIYDAKDESLYPFII